MENVPYLAAHRDKKAGKEESLAVVKNIIKGDEVTPEMLATLYSFFLPPKPKKITSPFEWVASICDDKASYSFCKYVEVKNGITCSATTSEANILMSDLDLDIGFYDVAKGYAGDDVAIMPDVLSALSEALSAGMYEDFIIEDLPIEDTPSGLKYILPWNNKKVDKKKMDSTWSSLDGPTVFYSFDGAFCISGYLKGIQAFAIFMPQE